MAKRRPGMSSRRIARPARHGGPSERRRPRMLGPKPKARAKPTSGAPHEPTMRIGHGYDLHRLEPVAPAGHGRPMVIGGVKIPDSPVGPVGHSDGDVLYHCVTDALLGAMAMPDIGQLFPDNDPRHDGQDSEVFLVEAMRRVRAAGYGVANLDVTVIAERPKIGPLKQRIRENLARLLGVKVDRVNVKGKTHEKVDAVGEGRAIECHSVVLLVK